MNNFIDSLDLPYKAQKISEDSYLIELNDSNEFSDVYSIISNNEDLTLVDDWSLTTDSNSMFVFTTDKYEIKLISDFEKDIYRVIIEVK